MKSLIARGDKSDDAFLFAHTLLVAIELWKAGCIEDLTGHAVHNDRKLIWSAFHHAINAMKDGKDADALLAIMNLKGFGSYPDENFGGERPAKRASAVLRMFNPDH